MAAGGLELASPDVQVIRQAITERAEALPSVSGKTAKDLSLETVEQETVDIALYQARDTNKMVRLLYGGGLGLTQVVALGQVYQHVSESCA